ncbi:protein of unknown function [Azospirillum lipoferum 4B]|uniref:Uncharacterized protein n=1 Tax=Azospirillum lipoferum (strain 4B) TaxID=862719 RepID=G7Z6C9_AZOL4|nr:protein of unknown function [Azospirillum lipoferum 4B]
MIVTVAVIANRDGGDARAGRCRAAVTSLAVARTRWPHLPWQYRTAGGCRCLSFTGHSHALFAFLQCTQTTPERMAAQGYNPRPQGVWQGVQPKYRSSPNEGAGRHKKPGLRFDSVCNPGLSEYYNMRLCLRRTGCRNLQALLRPGAFGFDGRVTLRVSVGYRFPDEYPALTSP